LALGITISGQTNVSCHGGKGSATANLATGGTTPYTYSWMPSGGNSLTATGLDAGTYTITTTDNHGCTATASVIITQPAFALGITMFFDNNVDCHGGTGSATANTATGGTTPYTYAWAPSGGTTLTATGLNAGAYTITTMDNHGCTATASTTITQPASALAITLSTQTNVSCYGGTSASITMHAATGGTMPYNYNWTPFGGTNLTVTSLNAGTYTMTVFDNHFCSVTSSVTITQPASILTSSLLTSADPTCHGGKGSASISAGGGTSPYSYVWDPNDGTGATVTTLLAGSYTVTVKDNHDCAASPINFTLTQPVELRDSIVSSGCNYFGGTALVGAKYGVTPYTYTWSGGGTGSTMTDLSNGTYSITVTDNDGCTGSEIVKTISCHLGIIAPDGGEGLGVNNFTLTYNITFYPNPSRGEFNITGLEKGMTLEMYDYTGRKITTITANDISMQLNLSNQADGIYLIRIMSEDGTVISQKKVVKTQ